jgi:hypothetical protein
MQIVHSIHYGLTMLRPWFTLAAILAAFFVNTLSNIAPINGQSIGELSNTMFKEVLITPANYAFIIWGVIYVGLFAFGIYQLLPNQRHSLQLDRISYLVAVSCISQCLWVLVFLMRWFSLSFLAMFMILLALIAAYLQSKHAKVPLKKWFVQIPISIYLAWISVATVVNGAISLYAANWSGWGLSPEGWTILMLAVAAGIAGLVTLRYQDIAFVGVFVWAFSAIAVKHSNNSAIAGTAAGLALFLLGLYGVRTRYVLRGDR